MVVVAARCSAAKTALPFNSAAPLVQLRAELVRARRGGDGGGALVLEDHEQRVAGELDDVAACVLDASAGNEPAWSGLVAAAPSPSERAAWLHGSSWAWRAAWARESPSEEAVAASCVAAKPGPCSARRRRRSG